MEIETDKTTVGVPSPGNGIIEEIYVNDGDTVKSKQNLFKINITGEAPKAAAAAPKAEAPKAAPPPPPKPAASAAPPPPPPSPPKAAAGPPPPPPPKPTAPISAIPVAAIRHAQSIDSATVKVTKKLHYLMHCMIVILNYCFGFRFHQQIIQKKLLVHVLSNVLK